MAEDTPAETLGQRIRRLRQAKGWSMERLGQTVGVNKTAVYDVERGKSAYVLPHNLERYAEALGTSVAYLQSGLDPMATSALPPIHAYLRATYPDLPDEDIRVIEYLANAGRERQRLRHQREAEDTEAADATG